MRKLASDMSFPGSMGNFRRDFQNLACYLFTVQDSIMWNACLQWQGLIPLNKRHVLLNISAQWWRMMSPQACMKQQPDKYRQIYDLFPLAVTSEEVLPPFLILISKHLLKKKKKEVILSFIRNDLDDLLLKEWLLSSFKYILYWLRNIKEAMSLHILFPRKEKEFSLY